MSFDRKLRFFKSEKMDGKNIVVCDNGTGYGKFGFARENFPTSVFPCVVGRPLFRYEESLMEQQVKTKTYDNLLIRVGDEGVKIPYRDKFLLLDSSRMSTQRQFGILKTDMMPEK